MVSAGLVAQICLRNGGRLRIASKRSRRLGRLAAPVPARGGVWGAGVIGGLFTPGGEGG